jgi:predicted enzyme related to lactoylglutathione lyase
MMRPVTEFEVFAGIPVCDHAAARAGRALLTVIVDDLDAQVAQLAERGLATDPIDTVPGVVRKAEIRDPDGNRITFGQPVTQPQEEAQS